MPCTKDVLLLHTKRASYQAYLWRNALQATLSPPPISEFGLEINDGNVRVKWMTASSSRWNCRECDGNKIADDDDDDYDDYDDFDDEIFEQQRCFEKEKSAWSQVMTCRNTSNELRSSVGRGCMNNMV
ncbi:Hypothetical predicted protein [Paramuricea clavata]|uniref:Uncharacterized protein n=1 Tax=Paramuricea clavata TaxID=317549 RepID=A0A7D9M4T7_PARCT|nr:Hypothetical predicted protein [Paramuricea clavata]